MVGYGLGDGWHVPEAEAERAGHLRSKRCEVTVDF